MQIAAPGIWTKAGVSISHDCNQRERGGGYRFLVNVCLDHYKLTSSCSRCTEWKTKTFLRTTKKRFISPTESSSSYLQRRSSMLECPVDGNRREVFLFCLPGTLCWPTIISKKGYKNSSLEDRWNQCALPADWSVCGWIAWWGYWFEKENKSFILLWLLQIFFHHELRIEHDLHKCRAP